MTKTALPQSQDWNPQDAKDKTTVMNALQASGEGPGRFLRRLRELDNLSLRETASRLGVSAHQLEALEKDDHQQLPAPIYVRNYLERYAQLLGVEKAPLLEAYEKSMDVMAPELARVSLRERLNSRHISMRWATYMVVVALLGLFLYWLNTVGVPKMMIASDQEEESKPAELALPEPPRDLDKEAFVQE